MPFNILDIFVIIILMLFIFIGLKRGLVATFLSFSSSLISLILSNMFYPMLSSFFRRTGIIYDPLKEVISETLGINELIQNTAKSAQTQLINSLSIPDFIKHSLTENNNPEIYKLLDATQFDDYVSGFIANIFINIISIILVFLIIFIGMKIFAGVLDILTKLPIISTFNKTGGAIVGFLQGVIFLWIITAVLVLFFAHPENTHIFEMLDNSLIAKYFYEHNFILKLISKFVL